jgi:hypothetical protein
MNGAGKMKHDTPKIEKKARRFVIRDYSQLNNLLSMFFGERIELKMDNCFPEHDDGEIERFVERYKNGKRKHIKLIYESKEMVLKNILINFWREKDE